jgi:hypothetical protein
MLVCVFYAYLHKRPRVQRAPGFPCASSLKSAKLICKTRAHRVARTRSHASCFHHSSWPGLSRPSTSCVLVDTRHKAGHDDKWSTLRASRNDRQKKPRPVGATGRGLGCPGAAATIRTISSGDQRTFAQSLRRGSNRSPEQCDARAVRPGWCDRSRPCSDRVSPRMFAARRKRSRRFPAAECRFPPAREQCIQARALE